MSIIVQENDFCTIFFTFYIIFCTFCIFFYFLNIKLNKLKENQDQLRTCMQKVKECVHKTSVFEFLNGFVLYFDFVCSFDLILNLVLVSPHLKDCPQLIVQSSITFFWNARSLPSIFPFFFLFIFRTHHLTRVFH